MALKKLEELGYKPKKRFEKQEEIETTEIIKEIQNSELKQEILNLLLESLSESDPREILIYGMYVKKCLSPIISVKAKDRIEKTLELLQESLGKT